MEYAVKKPIDSEAFANSRAFFVHLPEPYDKDPQRSYLNATNVYHPENCLNEKLNEQTR